MRILGVDDDVFNYVVSHMRDFEDTPSRILRRLLGIERPGPRVKRRGGPRKARKPIYRRNELTTAIDLAGWLPFDVQRYLYLLASVEHLRRKDFRNILSIRGRTRIYFARTESEIEASGTATQPRLITGTTFWALTNIPTREKERILRSVLTMLDFEEEAMLAAREYLVRGRIPTATV
jgi:negative modulator of initiation of replication